MTPTSPEQTLSAINIRNTLAKSLSAEQLGMVAAWLNQEALEAESADIFILAQMMAAIAGLKKTG